MRKLSIIKAALLLAIAASVYSCQKEKTLPPPSNEENIEEAKAVVSARSNQRRPFKGTFTTFYNFIPDVANGWTPPNPAPAWYPGGGSGNLTHLGNSNTFFNQYAVLGPNGLQTLAAPVNMFFASELQAVGLTIPNNVTTIFYKDNGKSIWCEAIGASTSVPVSPTRIEFTAQLKIIGGTRQFSCAKGEVTLYGYFNPQNNQDAGFEVDGWIKY